MLTRHAQEIFGDAWEDEGFRDWLTPVDITPVAKWFYRDNEQENFRVDEDFPRVAPPWPATWIEFVPPNSVNNQGDIKENVFQGVKRFGAYIIGAEVGRDLEGREHPVFKLLRASNREIDIAKRKMEKFRANEDARWWMACQFFAGGKNFVKHIGGCIDFLDEDGKIMEGDSRLVMPGEEAYKAMKAGMVSENKVAHMLNSTSFPFFFGISLCHCNNVEVGEDGPAQAVRENRKSKGQNPGQTFKTLDIEPMKEKSASSSSGGDPSVSRALHICRGHFKTYTEDAPLFGEHTGTYWWPMHTRGSAENGEVKKDYRVNEPNQ